MLHQPCIFAVVKAERLQILAVGMRVVETVLVARPAGVGGIAAAMDDPRFGEDERDESQYLEIVRQLVDDADGAGDVEFEKVQEIVGEIDDLLAAEGCEILAKLARSLLVSQAICKTHQPDELAGTAR